MDYFISQQDFPLESLLNRHQSPGLLVFQIQQLSCVLIHHHQTLHEAAENTSTSSSQPLNRLFCIADCYIILHSFTRSSYEDSVSSTTLTKKTCQEEEEPLDYQIYTWLGSQAQPDKRFCAAMFAVALRNYLLSLPSQSSFRSNKSASNDLLSSNNRNTSLQITRQTQGDETLDFLALFSQPLEYLDASLGSESSLLPVRSRSFPLFLYKMHSKRVDFCISLVEPNWEQLTSSSVFILDYGLEIFQWNGRHSGLQHRLKARLITARINKNERKARAIVIEMDEGQETTRFWELLGGKSVDQEDSSPTDDGDETQQGPHVIQTSSPTLSDWIPPRLYRSPQEKDVENVQNCLVFPSAQETSSAPSKSLLLPENAFILDTGPLLFLWIGRGAPLAIRQNATELLTRILPLQDRPRWLGLQRCAQGSEPEIFKLYFSDWEGSLLLSSSSPFTSEDDKLVKGDSATSPLSLTSADSLNLQTDISALFSSPLGTSHMASSVVNDKLLLRKTLEQMASLLLNMMAFVYEKGKFMSFSPQSSPHYPFLRLDRSYIFLCVYKVLEGVQSKPGSSRPSTSEPMSSESPQRDPGSGPSEFLESEPRECVLYFWKGPKSSRQSFATFRFSTQQELETLIFAQYGCQVKITPVEFGREPLSLLSHLKNELVYTLGGSKEQGDVELFHLRVDPVFETVRACQLKTLSLRFLSQDGYFFRFKKSIRKVWLWLGKKVTHDEEDRMETLCGDQLVHDEETLQIIRESDIDELREFETLLESSDLKVTHPPVSLESSPRFFQCSCSLGYFSIKESSPHFGQNDLLEDTCCLLFVELDSDRKEIWVWKGREASDVVSQLTLKAVHLYLLKRESVVSLEDSLSSLFSSSLSLNMEKDMDSLYILGTCIKITEQGRESLEFVSLFLGWDWSLFERVEPSNRYRDSLRELSK